ncbi:hypothetical protein D9758_018229 [Tetrapyrgos nigripes]|uniref:Uncharacterized protein n=1 Tax=Tetrapyrgos nigripes TaxID=182062 RepID=A0A8H5F6K2_9AGAR|nr:hypothetical protein D9758_018229 [Tetrapyrgos nigripes]
MSAPTTPNQPEDSVSRLRPTRGRRDRSPVSLFALPSYGYDAPKAPKPLAKLDPRHKPQVKAGLGLSSAAPWSKSHSPSSSFDSDMSASSSKGGRPRNGSSGFIHSLGRRKSLVKAPPPPLPTAPSVRSLIDPPETINTPDSASFLVPTEDEVKRHQLQKASRMLGEDIPPSLIYGSVGLGRVVKEDSIHRRSHSSSSSRLHDLPVISPLPPLPVPSPSNSKTSSPINSKFRRPKTAPSSQDSVPFSSSPSSLSHPNPDSLVIASSHSSLSNSSASDILPLEDQKNLPPRFQRSTDPSSSSKDAARSQIQPQQPAKLRRAATLKPLNISTPSNTIHAHSHSDDIKHLTPASNIDTPFASAIEIEQAARPDPEERSETPFVDSLIPKGAYFTAKTWTKGATERRERREGWSGEWNRQDMQDVISKLRNLK